MTFKYGRELPTTTPSVFFPSLSSLLHLTFPLVPSSDATPPHHLSKALADSVMGRPAPPPPPSPPGTPDQLHWSASIELPEEVGVSERGSIDSNSSMGGGSMKKITSISSNAVSLRVGGGWGADEGGGREVV